MPSRELFRPLRRSAGTGSIRLQIDHADFPLSCAVKKCTGQIFFCSGILVVYLWRSRFCMPIIYAIPFATLEKPRSKRSDNFYQRQPWKRLRQKIILRDQGYCRYCKDKTAAKAGDIIDHWLPRRKFPELELYSDNLFCCCSLCHSDKTRVEISFPGSGSLADWLTVHGFPKPPI